MDGSNITGNLAGKPCDCNRVCDNFGHCHTACSCPAMKAESSRLASKAGKGL